MHKYRKEKFMEWVLGNSHRCALITFFFSSRLKTARCRPRRILENGTISKPAHNVIIEYKFRFAPNWLSEKIILFSPRFWQRETHNDSEALYRFAAENGCNRKSNDYEFWYHVTCGKGWLQQGVDESLIVRSSVCPRNILSVVYCWDVHKCCGDFAKCKRGLVPTQAFRRA